MENHASKPSLALLMSGDPYHDASRCLGCATRWYRLRPAAQPINRAGEFQGIYQHLAKFAQPSLFVFHTNTSVWRPFVSDLLKAAVISDECSWKDHETRRLNISSLATGQYVNIYCSLLLMRAHEKADGNTHDYVARMRTDFPVTFAPSWFTSDASIVVHAMNHLQDTVQNDWTWRTCSAPGSSIFPNDQFFMGQNSIMSKLLKEMIHVSKFQERHLFAHLAILGATWTYVRVAPALPGNLSISDLGMLINATGVYCRHDLGRASSTWERTCTFRRWDPRRTLSKHGVAWLELWETCLEHIIATHAVENGTAARHATTNILL